MAFNSSSVPHTKKCVIYYSSEYSVLGTGISNLFYTKCLQHNISYKQYLLHMGLNKLIVSFVCTHIQGDII